MEVWLLIGSLNVLIINREPTDEELADCSELFRFNVADDKIKPDQVSCDYFPDHENLEAPDEVARRFR